MAKEKNKPVPVRFDLKLMEVLKEEEKIETPQQALNFLANFWENNRPSKEDFGAGMKEPKTKEPKAAAAIKPGEAKKKESSSAAAAHPSGLSGIDLTIWKAEQKEKNKNAE